MSRGRSVFGRAGAKVAVHKVHSKCKVRALMNESPHSCSESGTAAAARWPAKGGPEGGPSPGRPPGTITEEIIRCC